MKAISILGTASNSGKSWLATALCAWLRERGIRVAPFKAQNMSNNSCVTLDGGEIGRAQGVQAEACGLAPQVEMNPILLKPSGGKGSQLVCLGQSIEHIAAADYYKRTEALWKIVSNTLDFWKDRCDVLVIEGAGSPVELNLMDRDLVNLRPITYLDGKWLLVGDIERGGVFAQLIGTWHLLPEPARSQGLGTIVNKFRGDPALFDGAGEILNRHIEVPYLGLLPFEPSLQPESEDSLCGDAEQAGSGATIAWIRFPRLSNSSDCQPWLEDTGVRTAWVNRPEQLTDVRAIVLPGSKDTLADLAWLHERGLGEAIQDAARRKIPIVGICGGFQMLGETVEDPTGEGGTAGHEVGLNLLPVSTRFAAKKKVTQVRACWGNQQWATYEIHMGTTTFHQAPTPLFHVKDARGERPEGIKNQHVWGTYLHGLFALPAVRQSLADAAGIRDFRPSPEPWRERSNRKYREMAECLDRNLDMQSVTRYVES
ncbi:MAG: cobyric acid synthase [Opitutales bacterium]